VPSWDRARGPLFGTALVALVGVPLVAHAMRERREELARVAQLEEVVKNLQPLAQRAGEGRRVFINGAPFFFRAQTSTLPVAKALDLAETDCESGDPSRMLGTAGTSHVIERGEPAARLGLTKVIRQDGEGVAAALCVFHASDDHGEGTAQTRYTLAHETDDHRVSLFTVSTLAQADVYAVFPEVGDAPGGDFTGIPRPRDSRRLFAATIEGDPYAVRIYEGRGGMDAMVKQYDADMALAGWTRSEAVARAMPGARFYSRGDERFVASFEDGDDVARVSIAPFAR
jgi:hypothetical protein